MSEKLTFSQRAVLQRLAEMAARYPDEIEGLLPGTIGAKTAIVCRKELEAMGLVNIDRTSAHHFRYSLTDAGRAALQASPSEPLNARTQGVEEGR